MILLPQEKFIIINEAYKSSPTISFLNHLRHLIKGQNLANDDWAEKAKARSQYEK